MEEPLSLVEREMSGGDQYLGYSSIGNAMVGMVLASADSYLFMQGGQEKDWFGN